MKRFALTVITLLVGATFLFGQGIRPGNSFAAFVNLNGLATLIAPTTGVVQFRNPTNSRRIAFQFSAIPAVSSGFGTSPAIVAGSNDSAGQIDVGTGGAATSGVINFGSTWATAPFCLVGPVDTTTTVVTRASTSTTQLTFTASAAWPASEDLAWICVGP